MKSMVLIPLAVAGCVGGIALVLWLAGVRFNLLDPLNAAVVTAIAATIGIIPILVVRQTDPASIVQLALAGTVLHMLCTAALVLGLVGTHLADFHGAFIFWLLGAFWMSLAILVWQLRRVILDMTATLKVQN
jgi:hypothetical protein